MPHQTARLAAVTLLTASLASCSGEDPSASPGDRATSASTSTEPASDLPDPLRLEDIGARTVRAQPFADFAVAAGSGVWVSGVTPGAVRYDGATGAITARARIPGEVGQALAATATEVLVPVRFPDLLLRLSATTGDVRARVTLPGGPQVEAAVGIDGDTGYVLVDGAPPQIVVVQGDRVTDQIDAPDAATAVRAGFGSLWVPTLTNTVERYSLASKMWTSIPVGPTPRFLDIGFAAVWVMNQGDGSVTRIDTRSGATETLPVAGEPIGGGDLTVGAGAVWLRTDSQVARIDPHTRSVTHLIDLPPGSASAAATEDLLVISNHDHGVVHLVPLPLPQ